MIQNALMSKPKRSGDRHKPGVNIRVARVLAERLRILAERNVTSVSQETARAVRELLIREELWPPRDSN